MGILTSDEIFHVNEGTLEYWLRNGQGFVANGRGVTATNANLLMGALSVFNPSGSGKTFLVFNLRCLTGSSGSSLSEWMLTTSDPAFGTAVTPAHLPGATAPSTVASCSQTPTGATTTVSAPGTRAEEFIPTSLITYEILTNGAMIVLPPGNGLAVMMFVGTTGNFYQAAAKWIEF